MLNRKLPNGLRGIAKILQDGSSEGENTHLNPRSSPPEPFKSLKNPSFTPTEKRGATNTKSDRLENTHNPQDLLDLGIKIYNNTPNTQRAIVSPGVRSVTGNKYNLKFDSNQNTFTISEELRGCLLEADLANPNNITVRSPVTAADLIIFQSYLETMKLKQQQTTQKKQKEREIDY